MHNICSHGMHSMRFSHATHEIHEYRCAASMYKHECSADVMQMQMSDTDTDTNERAALRAPRSEQSKTRRSDASRYVINGWLDEHCHVTIICSSTTWSKRRQPALHRSPMRGEQPRYIFYIYIYIYIKLGGSRQDTHHTLKPKTQRKPLNPKTLTLKGERAGGREVLKDGWGTLNPKNINPKTLNSTLWIH